MFLKTIIHLEITCSISSPFSPQYQYTSVANPVQQKSCSSITRYDNIINTENTLPTIEAASYRDRAFLGYALLNTIEYNNLDGDYAKITFVRSLNTQHVDNQELDGLRESIAKWGLLSRDEDKCLNLLCRKGDVKEESLIHTWKKEDLLPIEFTESESSVQLANGAHRIDAAKLMHHLITSRIVDIKMIVAEWHNTPNIDAHRKARIESSEADIEELKKTRDETTFWAIKVYDLGKSHIFLTPAWIYI